MNSALAFPLVQVPDLGSCYEIQRVECRDVGFFLRRDVYYSKQYPQGLPEAWHAAGPRDYSPHHNQLACGPGAGYDPACSCCWLNIPHTQEKHFINLAERGPLCK